MGPKIIIFLDEWSSTLRLVMRMHISFLFRRETMSLFAVIKRACLPSAQSVGALVFFSSLFFFLLLTRHLRPLHPRRPPPSPSPSRRCHDHGHPHPDRRNRCRNPDAALPPSSSSGRPTSPKLFLSSPGLEKKRPYLEERLNRVLRAQETLEWNRAFP